MTETPDTASARPRTPGRGQWVAIGLGAVLLATGIWVVTSKLPGWLRGPVIEDEAATTRSPDEARKIHASLFYVSSDGASLVAVSREVPYGATPVEQARRIVEAQVQKPPAGTVSAIPDGTTVRAVFLTDRHEAYVDLGGAIATGHSGGSLNETLAVYAIVNALTVNLPEIATVQILIEGQEVDSLSGHLDLRRPLGKDLERIEKGQ